MLSGVVEALADGAGGTPESAEVIAGWQFTLDNMLRLMACRLTNYLHDAKSVSRESVSSHSR